MVCVGDVMVVKCCVVCMYHAVYLVHAKLQLLHCTLLLAAL